MEKTLIATEVAVQEITTEVMVNDEAIRELTESELLCVGGGNAEVNF